MALDPNERPPGGGPTYKTRELLEVLAHIVPGVLLLIFAFTARLGGVLFIFLPFALALIGLYLLFHGVRKYRIYRQRWGT